MSNVGVARAYNNVTQELEDPQFSYMPYSSVVVERQFSTQAGERGVEEIRFADGTVWTQTDLLSRLPSNRSLIGSDGSEQIFGFSWSESIDGREGNDTVYGYGGDDSLSGSAGNDRPKVVRGMTGSTRAGRGCTRRRKRERYVRLSSQRPPNEDL